MNPDEWRSPWEYQRIDEIHHQRMNALKDYFYNDDNFDDEANAKRYSEREMEMQYEVSKERIRAGLERQYEGYVRELEGEIDKKSEEISKLNHKLDELKNDLKKVEKMKELLKQYALYSEIEYDEESLTLVL